VIYFYSETLKLISRREDSSGARVVIWGHRFLIVFGLVLFSVGLYLGFDAYQHVSRSIDVEGEVVELKYFTHSAAMYPVVRYTGPGGHEYTLQSSSGSNPPSHYVGEKVRVLVDPNDPGFADNAVIDGFSELWGGPLFLMGFGALFVLITLGVRYLMNLDDDDASESTMVDTVLNIFVIIGFVLLAIALNSWSDTKRFVSNAVRVDGTVVAMRSYVGNSFVKYPVVRYTDHKGHEQMLYSPAGSNPPAFHVGEKVKVLLDANVPDYPRTATIDAFFQLWGMSLMLLVLGSFLVILPLVIKYVSNRDIVDVEDIEI